MPEATIAPFSGRRRLHLLIAIFIALSIAGGIAPTDRMEWWEGNIPIIALLVILVLTYRWWPLSDLSYLLLAAFLVLATLGSHFTYEHSPIGAGIGAILGIVRNPYDRVVHLAVGLFLSYPIYEKLPGIARVRAPWSYVLPVIVILAASLLWETAEVYYGIGMHQNPGYAGTQDLFDSQHDTEMALIGSAIAMAITALTEKPVTR